jgi:hypothetical protein
LRKLSISAADPVDYEAAVFVRCLFPREVTGVERVDLAVREEVVEVLVGARRRDRRVAYALDGSRVKGGCRR